MTMKLEELTCVSDVDLIEIMIDEGVSDETKENAVNELTKRLKEYRYLAWKYNGLCK